MQTVCSLAAMSPKTLSAKSQERVTCALNTVQGILEDIDYYQTPNEESCKPKKKEKKKRREGENSSYERYKATVSAAKLNASGSMLKWRCTRYSMAKMLQRKRDEQVDY